MNSIKDIIYNGALKYKNETAIQYLSKDGDIIKKTYLNLKEDSCAFSNALCDIGLRGKHIAIMGNSSYEWLIAYLGIVNSGSVVVTIDVRLPIQDIIDEIKRADVSAIIYENKYEKYVKEIKQQCDLLECFIDMSDKSDVIQYAFPLMLNDKTDNDYPINVDSCATIMFTSGTSGKSKGVMLSHKGLVGNAVACAVRAGFNRENTVILSVLPIFHIFCLSVDIFWGLYSGVSICFNDSLVNLFDNIHKFKANKIAMVPMMLELVYSKLNEVSKENPNLTKKMAAQQLLGGDFDTFTVGGAFLKPNLRKAIEEYGITIKEQYGMTENSCNLSTEHGCIHKEGALGKVLDSQKFKTVNNEIWVKGNTVMLGYYKDEASTNEAVVNGWLKTGDLGYIDDEQYLYLTGRKKLLITLSSGENVSSEQLEKQIQMSKLVKEVIVYQKGDLIVTQIYPDYNYIDNNKVENIEDAAQEIVNKVNSTNPTYKHIHKIIIRKVEFEKTASMKIKRENYLYNK